MSLLVSLIRETSSLSRLAAGGFHGRLKIVSRMGHSRPLGAGFTHAWPVVRTGPANFQQTKNQNGKHDQNENEGETRIDVVVEHNLAHLIGVLRRCQHLAFG